jgi:predicted glutamine amidotransferase
MCRLLAYTGRDTLLDDLIYKPKNSLVNQSFDAKELDEPLNGDGFGVGWYAPELGSDPGVFVSTSPAWSNRNLRYLAKKISSPCIFAHVRAASVGETSEANCHPFSFGNYMFMHNGGIAEFGKIKRKLRRNLPDTLYDWVRGQTDSEHFFATLLHRLKVHEQESTALPTATLVSAFRDTIREFEEMGVANKIEEESYLNMVVTDGKSIVASRYVTNPTMEPLSLYYSEGSRYICEDGVCRMEPAGPGEKSVLIVSEKLTTIRKDWHPVPVNHFVVVKPDLTVSLEKI